MLISILGALAPVVALLVVGVILRQRGMLSTAGRSDLSKILFWFFLPVLLFGKMAQQQQTGDLPWVAIGLLVAVLIGTWIVSWLATSSQSAERRGVLVNGVFRANGALVALPIVASLKMQGVLSDVDERAFMLLFAIMVPVNNVLSVTAFSLPHGEKHIGKTFMKIVRNPLILSAIAGLIVSFTCREALEPTPLFKFCSLAGSGTIALALIVAGSAIQLETLKKTNLLTAVVVLAKLCVVPAIAWCAGLLCGVSAPDHIALVVCTCAPVAAATLPMAAQMKGDEELMASLIVLSTALAPLTMFIWLLVVVPA